MDIQRLRKILSELNPFFWSPEVDRQLKAGGYPNEFPMESAKGRYLIALRWPVFPMKSAIDRHRLKVIGRSWSPMPRSVRQRKRFDELLVELDKYLSSHDNIFRRLLREFTSGFAQNVLLAHEKLIEGGGYSGGIDTFEPWTELLVCMSHKDFWGGQETGKGYAFDAMVATEGLPPYAAIDLAERTLTVGDKTVRPSDSEWDFLKELCFKSKTGEYVPRFGDALGRSVDRKNANDSLRAKLTTEIHKFFVQSSRDKGYCLHPVVHIKNQGQLGIRPTKSKQHEPGVN